MILANKKLLHDYSTEHADIRKPLEAWINEVEEALWKTPDDIKKRYPKASIIDGKTIVFDIKGNDYRVATKIKFDKQLVVAIKIGTHAEYDKWTL